MIASIVAALAFTAAAAANAFGLGGTDRHFQSWGYPRWMRYATALAELSGAAMLLAPRTREAGVLLLAVVLIGAIATLVRAHAGWRHLAPPLGFGALLIAAGLSVA